MTEHLSVRPRLEAVSITGIGVALPGAQSVPEFWRHISLGRSQVGQLTRFDPALAAIPVRVAAQLDDFDHRARLPDLDSRRAGKYTVDILATMAASADARRDAGLAAGDVDPRRLGIVMSTSRGPQSWWSSTVRRGDHGSVEYGTREMFAGLGSSPAAMTAIQLGARSLVTTVCSACVSGHHALGIAMGELRSGTCDAVLAGGHEFPLAPEVMRTLLGLGEGVLSPEASVPAQAIRPYHRARAGMALGEGSLVLCLERESSARARGARIYANLLSHVALNEANHPTTMDLTGKVTADVFQTALDAAGRDAAEVGYFCGHGTATRYNDLAESRAVRELYPGRRPGALPPIGSVKPIYGHTLGLAGVVNVAATALMLAHQRLAPTINLTEVDPECDQDHVADGPRDTPLDVAVSLAFALGSQTSVAVLGAAG